MVTESSRTIRASDDDLAYQRGILPGVSRTFALTIPVLPEALALVMTNAYLLCRIADTIEDDPGLESRAEVAVSRALRRRRQRASRTPTSFARDLAPLLSDRVLPAEHDLVRNTPAVIRVTRSCSADERAALMRCVAIMCRGMPEFQRNKSLRGLADLDELAEYCYYVAGVVGEMCTELFCLHCPELAGEARSDAALGRVVRPGFADDEHSEGHLGRPAVGRVLAAALRFRARHARPRAARRVAHGARVPRRLGASCSASATRICAMRSSTPA